MSFEEVLDQAIEMLRRRGRVTYRALKRQFGLDDDFIEDLKEELCFSHPVVDEAGRGLVWTGGTENIQGTTTSQPDQAEPQPVVEQAQPTHVHTPSNASPVQDAAERRQLTILFTDLVDSTKLSSELDAEDYREVVRAYQAACAEVIERFECHLAQTLGDGLLIYGGYPVAHDNDAERAVRAGLGILAAMKVLNERLDADKGIQLAVRVGIHTGPVVVGDVGAGSRHEQLALGEVPNVAARIQGLAEPDTVVISDATYRLVEGYFECQELGAQALRGIAEPITVYRVLHESGVQSRLDVASTRGLTPLVGREQAVGLLIERWEQSREGHGQVVLLSGEAGIGKSRLVQVLKDHVTEEPHTRWECRSSPYYQNTALYPIIDLIQRTLQWHQDDSSEERLEKLEQELSQYRVPLEESVPLFAPLLSLSIPEDRYPPLHWTPQRQRQKTLETIVAMLLQQTEQQPVLFILEDLHWTDPSTLELLHLLIDQSPAASIGVLLTCRPTFQPPWSSRSYLMQVTLNRLSREQIARMAAQVASGKRLPAEVLQQIVERTDGVPLFVEEMTKAVLEFGHLTETDGHYEFTGDVRTLAIPTTLQDLLMSRLDRLMTAKVIAQLGATIGRQFSYALLQKVAQLDESILQHELSRLVDAELLYQRGLPPQAAYIFKHALIQDAAYASLLKSTRQHYHQRIGQVLEVHFPETIVNQPELLAHHYTEAGLHEQAVEYWRHAGERAVENSASVEALRHVTQALDLLATLPDTSERTQRELALLTIKAPVLRNTQGQAAPEVEETYARAYALCQQMEDAPQFFPVLRGLWNVYLNRAELQAARQLGAQLLTLAQRQHDPMRLLWGHSVQGMYLYYSGALTAARGHFAQGLAFYDRQQHRSLAFTYGQDVGVAALTFLAWIVWLLGYPDHALTQSHEALSLGKALSIPYSLAAALTWSVTFHQFRRERLVVQEQAAVVIALASEHGFAQRLAWGTILHGWALAMHGHGAEGIGHMRQGLVAFRATGQELWQPYFLALLAEGYGSVGQPQDGLAVLAESLARVEKTGERWYEAELHRLKGVLLLSQSADHQAEAESCFYQALEVARNQRAKSWELLAATSLSRLWHSQGKRQDAYEMLAPVYEWFTEGFDTADLRDAKTLLDQLEGSR